jgi:hypothetical protein
MNRESSTARMARELGLTLDEAAEMKRAIQFCERIGR